MCEEAPTLLYCFGYALPIGCCLAGIGLTCFGCYRYYSAACLQYEHRTPQLNDGQSLTRQFIIKRDTLKKKMIDAFKNMPRETSTSNIKENLSLKEMKDTCPICISEYNQDTTKEFVGLIKTCGHYYHFECIWEWLERKRNCPICRESCDLTESDIRGISLKQALSIAHEDVAIPCTSGLKLPEFLETNSKTSTLTSCGSFGGPIFITTTPVLNDTGIGHDNMTLELESDNGQPEMETQKAEVVISEQPKSVHYISQMFENLG